MIVRFSTGVSITYNEANFLQRYDKYWILYNKDPLKKGYAIVWLPLDSGFILEWEKPCKFENPINGFTGKKALSYVVEHISGFTSAWKELTALKKALKDYDSRTGNWK